jgi:hypothetical protein
MFPRKITKYIAVGAVIVALVVGSLAIGFSGSTTGASGTATAPQPAAPTTAGAP